MVARERSAGDAREPQRSGRRPRLFTSMANKRWRRGVAAAASALLLGPAIATVSHAQPALAQFHFSAETVVTGIVTKDGIPVSGGDVVAMAWPTDEILRDMDGGQTIEMMHVAHTTTGSGGEFAVAVNPEAVGSTYLSPDGRLHLQLIIADAEHQITWFFTATRSESTTVPGIWSNPWIDDEGALALSGANKAPTHLTVDLGENSAVIEAGNEPEEWLATDGNTLGETAGTEAARVTRTDRRLPTDNTISNCSLTATSTFQNGRTEQFIRAIGLIYAPVTVMQVTGTSHTLGVALKVDGSSSWSQSGTQTVSFGASATSNYGATSSIIENRVNYRQWQQLCAIGPLIKIDLLWRPHSYHSLNTGQVIVSRPTSWSVAGNCTIYGANNTLTKDRGTNATFSAGVSLTVLSVSARAAFSNNTKLQWAFSQSGGWLCGSNGDGWVSAPQAGAFVR